MLTDKNESTIKNDPAENDRENITDNELEDHPGLKKMSRNPNPRANENLPDENEAAEGDKTDEVGSEITDGEAG